MRHRHQVRKTFEYYDGLDMLDSLVPIEDQVSRRASIYYA